MNNREIEVELLRKQKRRLKVVLALIIVAGLLVNTWQARRAAHAAEFAREEANKARQAAEVAREEAYKNTPNK